VGYDLHITRRKDWSQAGHDITAEEWLAYVQKDPELSLSPEDGPYFAKWSGESKYPDPWLDWTEGNIYTKNPDEALIDKMAAMARELRALVQGDDGEIYQSGHEPPVYPRPSALDRLRNWMRALRPAPPIREIIPPFQVGDRVMDVFHREATVTEIDAKSNHGLGKVKVRYDDGREMSFMLAASGLSPLQHKEKEK
jgi:hypothetical protein